MALSPKLELRQGQALVMTPQLQQAIRLLQLSHLDLAAYVEGELEQNPLLERGSEEGGEASEGASADTDSASSSGDSDGGDSDGGDSDGGEAGDSDGGDNVRAGEPLGESPGDVAANLDTDVENVFPDDMASDGISSPISEPLTDSHWSAANGSGGSFDRSDFDLEALLTREATLQEHLGEQLALSVSDPVQRMIGQNLIDQIDEAGYLREDLEGLAERLGCEAALVEATLTIMQRFDPPGVFARDLAECLALQLKDKDRLDPAMQTLIDNIELLARREFPALKKLCGIDDEDLTDMISEIRELDPKPGLKFSDEVVQPIVPDVFVRPKPDGSWQVELNSDTLPKVLVNQAYYANVAKSARGEADKLYLTDCLASANWLVKSLDQRAKTILKVASEIVRQQDAFLMYGVQHLRPLNLRTVADAIDMHESTVSRVTSNKYMATPRGIFELKYFFTSSIAAADGGDAHSAEAVRHRIKSLIDEENPETVLSDDQLVQALRESGIDIARRTVAKYREALGIPSSVQRRREKRQFA